MLQKTLTRRTITFKKKRSKRIKTTRIKRNNHIYVYIFLLNIKTISQYAQIDLITIKIKFKISTTILLGN